MNNVRNWIAQGVLGPDARPSEETDYRLRFDLDAIDFEKLTYIIDATRWTKTTAGAALLTAEELRARLAEHFLVVSPEEFFGDLETHADRIRNAPGPPGDAQRDQPMMFEFYPAVTENELTRIRDFDRELESEIHDSVSSQAITNLPWFTNNLYLRIFTSLMLGHHDDTGRALAAYAAAMDVTRRQLLADVASSGVMSFQAAEEAAARLEEHFEFARYAAPTLMGYGQSHEFGSYFDDAKAEYSSLFAAAANAVERFYQAADEQEIDETSS